jgi:hypothetical protein
MRITRTILLLVLPIALMAQGKSTGSAFLQTVLPARTSAMGDALAGDPFGSGSSFSNPASLVGTKTPGVMFSQIQWVQDMQTQIVSAHVPLPLGTVGLSISSTSVDGIEVRDIPGTAIGTFVSRSSVFRLGYALSLSTDISVGTNLKYLYEKIYIDDASGYALDFGGLYNTPISGLTVGMALTNIGQVSKFRTQSSELPTAVKVGGTFVTTLSDFEIVGALTVAHESNSAITRIHLGSEATYDHIFSIRMGYQTHYDIRGLTAGLGFRYSIANVDYAYLPFSQDFGSAHILTIGIEF